MNFGACPASVSLPTQWLGTSATWNQSLVKKFLLGLSCVLGISKKVTPIMTCCCAASDKRKCLAQNHCLIDDPIKRAGHSSAFAKFGCACLALKIIGVQLSSFTLCVSFWWFAIPVPIPYWNSVFPDAGSHYQTMYKYFWVIVQTLGIVNAGQGTYLKEVSVWRTAPQTLMLYPRCLAFTDFLVHYLQE